MSESFPEVVVKLGAQGALWAGRERRTVVRAAARPVEVVDSTGAGDAFAAGWLPVWLAAGDPAAALAAGCALAARAVTQVGARPGDLEGDQAATDLFCAGKRPISPCP